MCKIITLMIVNVRFYGNFKSDRAFVQNEILGMKWLDRLVAAMLEGFGMD